MSATKTKYPNADTSAERLAEIEKSIKFAGNAYGYDEDKITRYTVLAIIRDLLAMLEERSTENTVTIKYTAWLEILSERDVYKAQLEEIKAENSP